MGKITLNLIYTSKKDGRFKFSKVTDKVTEQRHQKRQEHKKKCNPSYQKKKENCKEFFPTKTKFITDITENITQKL